MQTVAEETFALIALRGAFGNFDEETAEERQAREKAEAEAQWNDLTLSHRENVFFFRDILGVRDE